MTLLKHFEKFVAVSSSIMWGDLDSRKIIPEVTVLNTLSEVNMRIENKEFHLEQEILNKEA